MAITHLFLPIVAFNCFFLPVFFFLTEMTGSFAGAALFTGFAVIVWAVLLFRKLNNLRDQTDNIKGYKILMICSFITILLAILVVVSAGSVVISV